jgi:hypothetical protein
MALDLFFDETDRSRAQGLVKATVQIGAHKESVRPHVGLWSKQDYADHWQTGRDLCARGSAFVVLATSYAPDNWDLWVGRKTIEGYRFFNCLVPVRLGDVQISGKTLSLSDYDDFSPDRDEEVSKWDVKLADIVT